MIFLINSSVRRLIFILMLSAWLFPAAALAAEAASITKLAVSKEPLKVSFQVDGAFSGKMEEAVRSGLPASFNFIVKLEKVNSVFPNENVGTWEFKHTVKYDSLLDEYALTLDEEGERVFKVKSMEEAKKIMQSFEAPVSVPQLVPGANYRVRVKAELGDMELPFILNFVHYFIEVFDFETGWQDYDFTN